MSEIKGASVVIVGGGVTGLSAGWWLARDGVDVLVLEKGLIGWEASGRNGGGCSHHHSPLFVEEQRLWPIMDELLGYPTEFRGERIRLAASEHQMALYGRALRNAERQGFQSAVLDVKQAKEMVPLAGDTVVGGYHYKFGGHANPHRTLQGYAWAMQDHSGRICSTPPSPASAARAGVSPRSRPIAARSAATASCLPLVRRPGACRRCSDRKCRCSPPAAR